MKHVWKSAAISVLSTTLLCCVVCVHRLFVDVLSPLAWTSSALKLFFPDAIHRNLFIPVHEWHVVCQLSLFYKLAVSTNF